MGRSNVYRANEDDLETTNQMHAGKKWHFKHKSIY